MSEEKSLPRFRLKIEYDGRSFVGWQRQDNGLGVQEAIESATKKFCGETVRVQGAGRTDSGVHALGQVAHLDLNKEWPVNVIRDALNAHLRRVPVSILKVSSVEPVFHARFSATSRSYQYRIVNRRAPLTLDAGRAWWVPQPLDTEAMTEAANFLVGKHDFTSFRASECQAKSPVRTLDTLTIERLGDIIEITARARSFLHHQVRNLVGSLTWVGDGKWTPAHIDTVLLSRDRRAGGPTAPADGLYLSAIYYDDESTPDISDRTAC